MMNTRRSFVLAAAATPVVASAQNADTKPVESSAHAHSLDSEKFRGAVGAGDIAAAVQLLDRDPALRYSRDAEGNSVYTLACLHGQTKIAEELTRRGLALDIFEAAVSGNVQRATELAKDDPGIGHHRSPDGRTPLHFAAAAGKPEMVIFLVTKGADLSAGPESPLLAAVDHPKHAVAAEMTQFLLMNASYPNVRRKDGKTPLHLSAARGYGHLARQLIHPASVTDSRE